MRVHDDRATKGKKNEVTNVMPQSQVSPVSSFQFEDNRPETVAQKKLYDLENKSQHAKRAFQLKAMADNYAAKQKQPFREKVNNTGLPDNMKAGMENLSGISLDDVKVYRNSDKPAQLQAHAYAQGTNIHLGAGQEKHLSHEAWHVVQQKQGRVKPTLQANGNVSVNDNVGLEKEADVMGTKALQMKPVKMGTYKMNLPVPNRPVVQKIDWAWLGSSLAAPVGGVSGAVSGTVKGAMHGYQDEDGVLAGMGKGLISGAKDGYKHPGTAVGTLIGGAAGNMIGSVGAVAGGVAGAVEGYQKTKSIPQSLAAGAAGATTGYFSPMVGGALAGAEIGKTIDPGHKTEIRHTTSHITLDNLNNDGISTNHKVGKTMTAKLAPFDAVRGSATGVNWTWMQFLRKRYPKANIVRGHLLNHDLGGFGAPENLYPISTLANQQHSVNVEQNVKNLLSGEIDRGRKGGKARIVNYTVEVIENSYPHDPTNTTFKCTYYADGEGPTVVDIRSQLGTDKGGFGGGHNNPLDGEEWHHGQRRGFEGDDERSSLSAYKNDKNIRIGKSAAGSNLTPNEDAKYTPGAGLTLENERNIMDSLMKNQFKTWHRPLKDSILMQMGLPAGGYFDTGAINFVRSTASYSDNKGDYYSFIELIVQVLQEKIDELRVIHHAHATAMKILDNAYLNTIATLKAYEHYRN